MADLEIPKGAAFRRAEGLHILIDLCRGVERFHVAASRQGHQTSEWITANDAEALSHLSRWKTAGEVGVPFERLCALVRANCLFWSTTRPIRVLTGDVLWPLEGKVALRRNVQTLALVLTSEGVRGLWHMPRRGDLDQASLGGITFATHEMHMEVGWVTVRCCPPHAKVVREILPLLDGRHDVTELAPDKDRRMLLEALARLGQLERHTPPVWNREAQLTWLAHAGVLYEAGGKRILIDPFLFRDSDPTRYERRPFDARDVGDIDAVLVTHGDHDHLNPPSLIRLPPDVPVVIPSVSQVESYQVDMFQLLSTIGCRRIIEVDEWERLEFGNVKVVATPFAGEDWGLKLACRTYVVSSPELTIFLNADSTSTPDVYARIAKEFNVDVAFVGVTGAAESYAMPPGYGYGDFYSGHIPVERHNQWVELCNGPPEAAVAARQVGARYAVGYAAGGAPYYDMAYSDRGTHAELARILRESGGPKPLDMIPGEPVVVPR